MTSYALVIITALGSFVLSSFANMQDCVTNGLRITAGESMERTRVYHQFIRAHCERIDRAK